MRSMKKFMKKIFLLSLILTFVFAFPVFGLGLSQAEIDQINAERMAAAEAEVLRVKEAAAIKAQNEIDAANATADAFAKDVERRKDAYEDWVDDQRELAGLERIYEKDDEEETENCISTEGNDIKEIEDDAALNDEENQDDINDVLEENVIDIPDADDTKEESIAELDAEEVALVVVETDENKIEQTICGVSLEDYSNLCKIVEAEAPNSGMNGKIMVANVIINRVYSPDFSNTITGVIMAPGQFSPVRNGRFNRAMPSIETQEAVKRALNGENLAGSALYFRSAKSGNRFMGKDCIASVGGNNFYY